MKRILITAFEPFGGDEFNAAQHAVENCTAPEGTELHRMVVPTVFGLAAEKVAEEIERLHPDFVVCVGEAGGRRAVTPERVGINVMDASIPDNAGCQPVDEKIVPDGPDAYFSTLPIKEMVAAMKAAGFDAAVSNTAGTFVCNSLMYGVLHHVAGMKVSAPLAGFLHVPADRPAVNADGSTTPAPLSSAAALSEALKVLV